MAVATPTPDAEAQPTKQQALPSGTLAEIGDLLSFGIRTLASLGGGLRYFGELLRQAGTLVAGSTFILVGIAFVANAECGLLGDYFFRALGAQAYVGSFTTACGKREFVPTFFGYILAAKVGCGYVAAIGSMRISEEIDAMESTGVSSMRYVIATRVLAASIVIPTIYIIAMFAGDLGGYSAVTLNIGDVSRAAWENVHWGTQSVADQWQSLIKVFVFTLVVTTVGCYYGYRARGGAVGVGAATARSMLVNLIAINVINACFSALFFADPKVPYGG